MTFLTATGDVELHAARRAVALLPADFAITGKRNLWTSAEQPPDGVVGLGMTTVELSAGRNPGSNTAAYRQFDLQFLHRFDGALGKGGKAKAAALARRLYEALHRCGEWTDDVDGVTYSEILALDVPIFVEDRYFSFNCTLHRDG